MTVVGTPGILFGTSFGLVCSGVDACANAARDAGEGQRQVQQLDRHALAPVGSGSTALGLAARRVLARPL